MKEFSLWKSFVTDKTFIELFLLMKLFRACVSASVKTVSTSFGDKAFRHVETLFVQDRNLVPSRPGIGWRKVNKPC